MSDRLTGIVMLWLYAFVSIALAGTVALLWTVGPWWLAAAFTVLVVPPAAVVIAWVVYTLIGTIRYDDVNWDRYGPHRREKPWLRL